jgi:hypothetical protein
LCLVLYNTWKVNNYIHSADRRYEQSANDFSVECSELRRSARFSRIGPTGYNSGGDSEQSETAIAEMAEDLNYDADGKTPSK